MRSLRLPSGTYNEPGAPQFFQGGIGPCQTRPSVVRIVERSLSSARKSRTITRKKGSKTQNDVNRVAWLEKDEASKVRVIEEEVVTEADGEAAGITGGKHQSKTWRIY